MHLATLMHGNHVICIVGVSRGMRFVKRAERSAYRMRTLLLAKVSLSYVVYSSDVGSRGGGRGGQSPP